MESGISAILPNMVEFIPMLIAFIIVAIVLGKFGWPKFNEMLEAREKKIADDLKNAEDSKTEAARILQENTDNIETAKEQAQGIVSDARTTADGLAKKIEQEARSKADSYMDKARNTIESDKLRAETEISQSAIDLSMGALSRFVSEELDDEAHRKIIERYVKEAGRLA